MLKYVNLKLVLIMLVVPLALTLALVVTVTTGGQQAKNTPPPPASQPVKTTLFFAGDIMLSRNVAGRMIANSDYNFPYLEVAEEVNRADIAFGNLESPFGGQGPYFVEGTLVFNADPKSVAGLKDAGFDILSTANNHAFDQGRSGVNFTVDHLQNNGIESVGTGLDCHAGKVIEKNGIKFGFLAYSYTALNDGGKSRDPLVCDWNDQKQTAADIALLQTKSDFVIVSAHMGTEYKREPDPGNVTLARAAIDAGADLLIGHHPHWIQITEEYKGKRIFYSLGNFVFDQMWSQDTREGLAVIATFENKDLKRFELKPLIIDNYCCPHWAISAEARIILDKLGLTENVISVKN